MSRPEKPTFRLFAFDEFLPSGGTRNYTQRRAVKRSELVTVTAALIFFNLF